MFCTTCGAAVEAENFCTNCGTRLHHETQVAAPAVADPGPVLASAELTSADLTSVDLTSAVLAAAEKEYGSARETPSTASRVWDGVERVGNAVTTVFAVIVGIGWILFGIVLFVAAANGYGNGWSWLIGIGMIVYGIFLIMPTRGTKIMIY